MPNEPPLKITRRNLPHWSKEGSTYFISFRLKSGTLTPVERKIVRNHIASGDRKYYLLVAAVIMPDHVHLILKPIESYSLTRIMQGIKSSTAGLLNTHRLTQSPLWQSESFDRILRDEREFHEKLQYMADNPLKAGLTSPHDIYDCWLTGSEFTT